MKSTRWSLGAAALTVLALSAYGCSDSAAEDDGDAGESSSSSGKPRADAGKTDGGKSSSSGGRSSSSGSSGRSSSSGGNGSSGGSSSSGSLDTDGGTGDGGPIDDGGADSGSPDGCTTITPQQWAASGNKSFRTTFLPAIPGSTDNELRLEFYFDGNVVGVHDLTAGDNTHPYSCAQCVDADVDDTWFFQTQGTVTVTAIAPSAVTATFANVKLTELAANNTPLPGGRCLTLTNGSIDVRPVP